jgi:hypothetical protein
VQARQSHQKMNSGWSYNRGGARLGEKYKSKCEAQGVSRRRFPQTMMAQAMATARLGAVQVNCPVANAETAQK